MFVKLLLFKGEIIVYTLREILNTTNENQANINGKWAPVRPLNYRYRTFTERLKDAWAVFNGYADAIKWPENQ